MLYLMDCTLVFGNKLSQSIFTAFGVIPTKIGQHLPTHPIANKLYSMQLTISLI